MSATFDPFSIEGTPFQAFRAARLAGGLLPGPPAFPGLETTLYAFTHAGVAAALRDPSLLQAPPGTYDAVRQRLTAHRVLAVFAHALLLSDPPRHGRLRRPLAPLMTPAGLAPVLAGLPQAATALLAPLAKRGRLDAVRELAVPFSFEVLGRLLGFPLDEPAALKQATAQIARALDLRADDIPVEADEACRFVEAAVERGLAQEPAPGSLTAAMRAEVEAGRWSHEDMTANLTFLLFAGQETVVDTFGNTLQDLEAHPAERARLARGEVSWAQAADEAIRFGAPVLYAGARIAAQEITLAGRRYPPMTAVVPVLGSASRDESAVPNGERLDFTRRPTGNLAFGSGLHICLGLHLARAEIAALLQALFTLAPDWRLERAGVKARKTRLFRGLTDAPVTTG